MTIKEAIKARHTVRKYSDRAISPDVVHQLVARIEENNDALGVDMKLLTDNRGILNVFGKMSSQGVRDCLVLAGADDTGMTKEKLGYGGADVMLYAQMLGLNSWWIGETFDRKAVQKSAGVSSVATIRGVIVIGYGLISGTPHKSKSVDAISSYDGEAPDWFLNGVEAVLLAPTARNRQAFCIRGEGRKVSMTCANGDYAAIDLGIGRYHFEIGAGKDNFVWV